MRGQSARCGLGVVGLHRQDDQRVLAGDLVGGDRLAAGGETVDRAFDAQASGLDFAYMGGVDIDE